MIIVALLLTPQITLNQDSLLLGYPRHRENDVEWSLGMPIELVTPHAISLVVPICASHGLHASNALGTSRARWGEMLDDGAMDDKLVLHPGALHFVDYGLEDGALDGTISPWHSQGLTQCNTYYYLRVPLLDDLVLVRCGMANCVRASLPLVSRLPCTLNN